MEVEILKRLTVHLISSRHLIIIHMALMTISIITAFPDLQIIPLYAVIIHYSAALTAESSLRILLILSLTSLITIKAEFMYIVSRAVTGLARS